MRPPFIEPVYAVITGYVTYGNVNSSQPGPCGTHRYFATLQTNDTVQEEYQIMGSVEQCWPDGLHVVPLPIGRAVQGLRMRNNIGEFRYQWHYRETPLVGPCNPGGG